MTFLRHKFRAPHLGKYPMETVKRVDKPTTRIDTDRVKRVPYRAAFFTRALHGDFGPKAQRERNRFIHKYPLAAAIGEVTRALIPLQGGEVAPDKAPGTDDPAAMAKHIKSACYFLDADIVGICEAPEYVWYSHNEKGEPIKPRHKYAIVIVLDQGYETMEGASGDDWISGTQSYRAYLRGAEIGSVIANYIRRLGYDAYCHSSLRGDVLQIPLMLLAGLGELSRIGELVLNPFIGPRTKTCVITTDLPMECDKPIDFGLQKFCDGCHKCARECPCGAIPFGDKVMYNSYEIWKPDVENCVKYRVLNHKGAGCSRCMKTCPLNKVVTKDGPLLQRMASWLGINAMWLKPLMIPIAVWLDDKLGHGKRVKSQKWWLDLEYDANGKLRVPEATNQRDINPNKPKPKNHRVALYPPEDLPPGDLMEPFPPDRKKAVAKGQEALRPENSPKNWKPRAEDVKAEKELEPAE